MYEDGFNDIGSGCQVSTPSPNNAHSLINAGNKIHIHTALSPRTLHCRPNMCLFPA